MTEKWYYVVGYLSMKWMLLIMLLQDCTSLRQDDNWKEGFTICQTLFTSIPNTLHSTANKSMAHTQAAAPKTWCARNNTFKSQVHDHRFNI